MVLGQGQVADKRGEGPAARALPARLEVAGMVLTLDALHTTKATARLITHGPKRTSGESASERKGGAPTHDSASVFPPRLIRSGNCGHVWFTVAGPDAALRANMTINGRRRSAGRVR
ncbi:hypothetical protein GCM10022252_41200 [Streptosporangium oxazolinicum]|uniref:Transposase IS4-like domain-containing protein n=1 Tax=Streptosporangium oxazolinicum TaxID=909287 RepID=A0ABP8B187_9ACTN